jgi:hypothetical protein
VTKTVEVKPEGAKAVDVKSETLVDIKATEKSTEISVKSDTFDVLAVTVVVVIVFLFSLRFRGVFGAKTKKSD